MLGRNLIEGRWQEAASGETIACFNPSSGSQIGSAPASSAADVDRAVSAARRSFESGAWTARAPNWRAQILQKVAALIDQQADEIAQLETRDNGLPISRRAPKRFVISPAGAPRFAARRCRSRRQATSMLIHCASPPASRR
jgi:acyl-CoA reductase-like NAD-dependent aldehyde dehydrogenase